MSTVFDDNNDLIVDMSSFAMCGKWIITRGK